MSEGWSYFSWVAKVPGLLDIDERLNLLGADGWELVTSLTTVKSWVNMTGNDLVFVLKKLGVGHQPSPELILKLTGVDPSTAW